MCENSEAPMEPNDWKAMYMILLDGITYAINICEDKTVSGALIKAMLDAEDYYINSGEAGHDHRNTRPDYKATQNVYEARLRQLRREISSAN